MLHLVSSFSRLPWPLTRVESFCYIVAVVASGFFLPWWAVLWPALVIGFFYGRQRPRIARAAGVLGGMSWFIVAAVRDIQTGFRISSRLAGAMMIPHPSFLFIIIFLIPAALSMLIAQLGRLASELLKFKSLQEGKRAD